MEANCQNEAFWIGEKSRTVCTQKGEGRKKTKKKNWREIGRLSQENSSIIGASSLLVAEVRKLLIWALFRQLLKAIISIHDSSNTSAGFDSKFQILLILLFTSFIANFIILKSFETQQQN